LMTPSATRRISPKSSLADYVVSGTGSNDTIDGMSKIQYFKQEPFTPDSSFCEYTGHWF
jgi:hypothetical protein